MDTPWRVSRAGDSWDAVWCIQKLRECRANCPAHGSRLFAEKVFFVSVPEEGLRHENKEKGLDFYIQALVFFWWR